MKDMKPGLMMLNIVILKVVNRISRYSLQPVPGGYRIVIAGYDSYEPVFETYPPLPEPILNQIVDCLEKQYLEGFDDGLYCED